MPYERPPLSKPQEKRSFEKPITSQEALDEKDITLMSGVSATSLDRERRGVALSNGTTIPYETLLLATGARPRRLACPGAEHAVLFRTRDDAQAVYDRAMPGIKVVIIGAGLIGLELAAELVGRGLCVTVLEAGPRPLGRNVPEALAQRLADRHREAGVNIFYGITVSSCTESSVRLSDETEIPADLIVAAIGVVPNTGLAEDAGLASGNGIQVDASLRTTDSRVFAAGDCASVQMSDGLFARYETWTNAQNHGSIAGRNLAGASDRLSGPVWFWSDQYDLGLQGVGETVGSNAVHRSLCDGAELMFFLGGDGVLVGAAGLGIGNAISKDIKIAQRLIDLEAVIDPSLLSDPNHNLKKSLRAV